MNLETILCPIDFSKSSQAALQYASVLAADTHATLHFVHVVDEGAMLSAGYNGVGYIADSIGQMERYSRDQLETIKPTVDSVGYQSCQLVGPPARTILKYAKDHQADLIVMGSHGRTGVTRLLMGSVAEAVARGAECPVLTVKHPLSVLDASGASAVESPKTVP